MNNLDLTRWLLKVREALVEQDEVKRNSMFHAADRFLKESNQPSLAFRRAGNGERGKGKSPRPFVQPKQAIESQARN